MKTSFLFFFAIFQLLFFFLKVSLAQPTCQVSSCGPTGPEVRFPFRIKNKQDIRCGYPGFDLYCNHQNQTILNLPNAGDFTVYKIDYKAQYVFINDPDFCLPKRSLHFSYSGSPFLAATPRKLTFLNCTDWRRYTNDDSPAFCMSKDYRYMVLVSSDSYVPPTCRYLTEVDVPVQRDSDKYHPGRVDLYMHFQLTWRVPGCRSCEKKGGICGFKNYTQLEIGCFNLPRGTSRRLKYGLIIGVGVPGLAWLIGVACYLCGKMRAIGERRSQLNLENLDFTNIRRQTLMVSGLDNDTIESYPKTVVGESRSLPNPNDGTCPICLVEYQPKETLRTIPECNHYFHANCVDEWLRLNSTCPICRKSLMESLVVISSTPLEARHHE